MNKSRVLVLVTNSQESRQEAHRWIGLSTSSSLWRSYSADSAWFSTTVRARKKNLVDRLYVLSYPPAYISCANAAIVDGHILRVIKKTMRPNYCWKWAVFLTVLDVFYWEKLLYLSLIKINIIIDA